jgi:hypothetical protein
MGMLIYVILHRLCLVNEHNAMINLKNDMVKNIQKPNEKKIPVILALKKSSRYRRVNTGAVVSLLFNSWKLFSQSSDHMLFLSFLVSWVKGVAISDNPSINLQ